MQFENFVICAWVFQINECELRVYPKEFHAKKVSNPIPSFEIFATTTQTKKKQNHLKISIESFSKSQFAGRVMLLIPDRMHWWKSNWLKWPDYRHEWYAFGFKINGVKIKRYRLSFNLDSEKNTVRPNLTFCCFSVLSLSLSLIY